MNFWAKRGLWCPDFSQQFALKNWPLLPAENRSKVFIYLSFRAKPARPNMLRGVATSSSGKRKSEKARIRGHTPNRYGGQSFKNAKPLNKTLCVAIPKWSSWLAQKWKGTCATFLIQQVFLAAGYINIINILVLITLSSIKKRSSKRKSQFPIPKFLTPLRGG